MNADLCRGWRERDVIDAWNQSSDLMRVVLTSLATCGGRCTIFEIADDIGKSRFQIQGSLSSWTQNVIEPMGVKDSEGKPSWPWNWEQQPVTDLWIYCMPEEVAAIIREFASR